MALIFDFETTGLPQCKSFGVYPSYKEVEKYSNCRAIELCVMFCDENLNEIDSFHYIFKRKGFSIKKSSIHHITDKISDTKGVNIEIIVPILKELLSQCNVLIAHNIDFDLNVLKSELFRLGETAIITELNQKEHFCSMKNTKSMIGLRNNYGLKNPKMEELYLYATNKKMKNKHCAKDDVFQLHEACKILYDKNKIKIIKIKTVKEKALVNDIPLSLFKIDFSKMKVIELKEQCKLNKIPYKSRTKKQQLIDMLTNTKLKVSADKALLRSKNRIESDNNNSSYDNDYDYLCPRDCDAQTWNEIMNDPF